MQTLRDAATLAALILLALTVRVDINGSPVTLDLDTPVEAAESSGSAADPRAVPLETRPVPAARATEADPETLVSHAVRLVVPQPPGIERRELVWEIDGKRLVIVLAGDEAAIPQSPPPPPSPAAPCDGSFDPGLSC